MNPYAKIWLIAGLCTTTYLLFKFVKTCMEQEPKKKRKSEKLEGNFGSGEERRSRKRAVNFGVVKSGESRKKRSEKKSEGDKEKMKIARPKPNFFIGVPIFDKEIHENVKKFQEVVIKRSPVLHPALVPISTLHITLAVTYLANETEVKKLKEKLEEWGAKNVKSFMEKPITMTFNGVNVFNDIVAYVNIKKSENSKQLFDLAQAINDVITSAGFSNLSKKFTPHVTVLKLSKDYGLLKSRKNFKDDFENMKQYTEYFGKQEATCVQLLSMNDPKDQNGYYKCYHQIIITNSEKDVDHTICCNPIPVLQENEKEA